MKAGAFTFLLGICLAGTITPAQTDRPRLMVLGIAQDAGFPQAACAKTCCEQAWQDQRVRRQVSCLGLIQGKRYWILDATPDFPDQMHQIAAQANQPSQLAGIFLTHAHIGHYTGLMHLGREVMGAKQVPVYAMPRMTTYLKGNGPWSQLVKLDNIALKILQDKKPITLTNLMVTPFLVPHRDEFSETVGYRIEGPNKTAIFIPDIDKWERWETPIEDLVREVDLAYLDAAFYADGEIPGRAMSEIPHPFIVETMARLKGLTAEQKARVRFIHLNHTNPALNPESEAARSIKEAGFRLAVQGEIVDL